MKILGICGSSRRVEISGTYKLVKTVLDATGLDYELICLRGKKINGCIACLRCAKDNICKVNDDMTALRGEIARADAYVIGAPNYYTGINALTHALLERLYQFRHRQGDALWGKLAVAVGVGEGSGRPCCDEIEKFMAYNFIETIATVQGRGAAACYTCGYGETCKVGAPVIIYGPDVKITDEMIPDVSKQPEVIKNAKKAGKLLAQRLNNGGDRRSVTEKMQKIMTQKFKTSS